MPGLPQRNVQFTNAYSPSCGAGSISGNGIWSKHRDEISFDELQKFWNELSPHERQELLKIDKQTLLEQARKNLYCSRCNGLLLEGFTQIIMYGKSMQHESGTTPGNVGNGRMVTSNQSDNVSDMKTIVCQDGTLNPTVHPWGGLVATREGILTLLDCFLEANSLKALQNVFNSARVRERERELLYPDACGGGGRGWISQGAANYGRGHGTRETCALHTARLSCDTLVDLWSALGDETRRSLLRMKEEDFIERLMYRCTTRKKGGEMYLPSRTTQVAALSQSHLRDVSERPEENVEPFQSDMLEGTTTKTKGKQGKRGPTKLTWLFGSKIVLKLEWNENDLVVGPGRNAVTFTDAIGVLLKTCPHVQWTVEWPEVNAVTFTDAIGVLGCWAFAKHLISNGTFSSFGAILLAVGNALKLQEEHSSLCIPLHWKA